MEFSIRQALADDAAALTGLMHASSAYGGKYASILDGYAVTPEQIARDVVFVAEGDGRALGFYSLTLADEPELDLLFVADGTQGSGLGRALFSHMLDEARRRGHGSVRIVSHPPSVGFYERMGARLVGTKPPSGGRVRWSRPILEVPTGRGGSA
ncbi:GNAT family N-acetyltransferase [Elioraea rosea]|uniref:GNAT family N-acetyltransferase n=1 Tax=Elioraea rosea TaxID=2492390 RepID=UPI00118616F0|nr:GNAT family N-acetyltransferase [Elioraea rosea]